MGWFQVNLDLTPPKKTCKVKKITKNLSFYWTTSFRVPAGQSINQVFILLGITLAIGCQKLSGIFWQRILLARQFNGEKCPINDWTTFVSPFCHWHKIGQAKMMMIMSHCKKGYLRLYEVRSQIRRRTVIFKYFWKTSWWNENFSKNKSGSFQIEMMMSHCKKVTWDYTRSDYRLDGGLHRSRKVIFKYFWKNEL